MAEIIRVPKLGEDSIPVAVLKWHKYEGESVNQGDIIVEIETDKSVIEIEAQQDGTLIYIKIPRGVTFPNAILGIIAQQGENTKDVLDDIEKNENTKLDRSAGVDIIRMPLLSDGMESAKIIKWHKFTGETVSLGDILAEVETEKALIELESFREGTLLYQLLTDKAVPVHTIIAIVGQKDTSIQTILKAEQN